MRIAVIGSGVVGAYLAGRLVKLGYTVDCYELSESSNLNEVDANKMIPVLGSYQGASKGRFFGIGGTSLKWGGQLSFLDRAMNLEENSFIQVIKENRNRVLSFYGLPEQKEQNDLINGYWLNPFKRGSVKFLKGCNLIFQNVVGVTKCNNGWQIILENDSLSVEYAKVYICAGVFESARILYQSNLIIDDNLHFKDHVSFPVATVCDAVPNLFGQPVFVKWHKRGIVTQRMNLDDNGALSVVFNEDSRFFSFIKSRVFGIERQVSDDYSIFSEIKFVLRFILEFLFKGKVHIDKRKWRLVVDIEKQEPASFNLAKGEINWIMDPGTLNLAKEYYKKIESYYSSNSKVSEMYKLREEKLVDTYHPFALSRANGEFVIPVSGMLDKGLYSFNTGMLPTISYSNPTASVLCLVENHLKQHG